MLNTKIGSSVHNTAMRILSLSMGAISREQMRVFYREIRDRCEGGNSPRMVIFFENCDRKYGGKVSDLEVMIVNYVLHTMRSQVRSWYGLYTPDYPRVTVMPFVDHDGELRVSLVG